VAFHKTFKPRKNNNGYRPEEVNLFYSPQFLSYVIHMIDVGEWLCYDVEVPEDDNYYLDIIGQFGVNDTPIMTAHLDGELLSDSIHGTEKLAVGSSATVGPFPMKKGTHRLKLEFTVPFLFDKFRIYTGKEAPVPEELYYKSDDNYEDGLFSKA
ncbi:MAG: hypothetical protein IIV81_01900, partial [Clostridia bacterium]|nr:hypothetical protein [Clostridia bacterium]